MAPSVSDSRGRVERNKERNERVEGDILNTDKSGVETDRQTDRLANARKRK